MSEEVLVPETSEGLVLETTDPLMALTVAQSGRAPVSEVGVSEIDAELAATANRLREAEDYKKEGAGVNPLGQILGTLISAAIGAAVDGKQGALIGAGGAATQSLEATKTANTAADELMEKIKARQDALRDAKTKEKIRIEGVKEKREEGYLSNIAKILGRTKIDLGKSTDLGITHAERREYQENISEAQNLFNFQDDVTSLLEGLSPVQVTAQLSNPKSDLSIKLQKLPRIVAAGAKASGLAPISEEEALRELQATGIPVGLNNDNLLQRFVSSVTVQDGNTIAKKLTEYTTPVFAKFEAQTRWADQLSRENTKEAGFQALRKEAKSLLHKTQEKAAAIGLKKVDAREVGNEGARAAVQRLKPGEQIVVINQNGEQKVIKGK